MKMNRYLWLLCLLLMMQLVTAQPAKNISADPAAQLRELTLLPRLTMPSVKMPTLRESFQKPQMPGYNIKKAIEVAKLKCPFLTARSTLFLNGFILGGAGFSKGLNEMTVNPGAYAKAALRFDFGRFNEMIQAIEIGISADVYSKKVEIMAMNPTKQFFFQGHLAFLFGRRK